MGEPGGGGNGKWGKREVGKTGSGANWRLRRWEWGTRIGTCHSSGMGEPHNHIEWGMTCGNRLRGGIGEGKLEAIKEK